MDNYVTPVNMVWEQRKRTHSRLIFINIGGVSIMTNMGCSAYPEWDGNERPAKYKFCRILSPADNIDIVFNEMVADGYNDIKFVKLVNSNDPNNKSLCVWGSYK